MNRYLSLVTVVICAVSLTSCILSIVSGPTAVVVNESATYMLELSGASFPITTEIFVVAQVPADWSLISSHYEGTSVQEEVSGTGTVLPHPGHTNCGVGDPVPEGYQKIWLSDGSFVFNQIDTAVVALEFQTGDVAAEHTLTFWVSTGLGDVGCDQASIDITQISTLEVPMVSERNQILLAFLTLITGLAVLTRKR